MMIDRAIERPGRAADDIAVRPARPLQPLLAAARRQPVGPLGPDRRPILVVLIDAEEEFDWTEPFSRDNRSVASFASQPLAHRVFERFAVVPTYLIDYPVA